MDMWFDWASTFIVKLCVEKLLHPHIQDVKLVNRTNNKHDGCKYKRKSPIVKS